MENYDASAYGERYVDVYDERFGAYEEMTTNMLVELARGEPVLELGIGTGRVALPLMAEGVRVLGIDASPAMINRLRSKPGGNAIPVTLGNFVDMEIEGTFSLIYVVLNTFSLLLTQEDQIRCLCNVARHLSSTGVFLMEVFMPDMKLYGDRKAIRPHAVTHESVSLYAAQLNPVTQRVTAQEIFITENGPTLYPLEMRYTWPSELDLMARIAGLQLCHRWGGWNREPFTSQSEKHISVYERVPVQVSPSARVG